MGCCCCAFCSSELGIRLVWPARLAGSGLCAVSCGGLNTAPRTRDQCAASVACGGCSATGLAPRGLGPAACEASSGALTTAPRKRDQSAAGAGAASEAACCCTAPGAGRVPPALAAGRSSPRERSCGESNTAPRTRDHFTAPGAGCGCSATATGLARRRRLDSGACEVSCGDLNTAPRTRDQCAASVACGGCSATGLAPRGLGPAACEASSGALTTAPRKRDQSAVGSGGYDVSSGCGRTARSRESTRIWL